MAIVDVIMHSVKCDNCDKTHEDSYSGIIAWNDSGCAEDMANSSGWISCHDDYGPEHEGKHYCYGCYDISDDDDDSLIIHPVKTTT